MTTHSGASTLLGLLEHAPAQKTAIILPEHNIRVSYGMLRDQVHAVAEQLAAAGINPGDRVGIALPNGLPLIVSFLAASMAGTAAPLNPAYKEDEFRFYLEDTSAKVLILPPEGIDEARRPPATAFRFSRSIWTAQARSALKGVLDENRSLRHRSTAWRSCSTPAAAPDGPSASRSRTPICRFQRGTLRATTGSGPMMWRCA